MKRKIFLLLLLFAFQDYETRAQIVKNTDNKAKTKVARASAQKVDKAMNKDLDKAEGPAIVIKVSADSAEKKEAPHSNIKEPDHYKTKSHEDGPLRG